MRVFEFVIEKNGKQYLVQITANNIKNARKYLLKDEPNAKILKEQNV